MFFKVINELRFKGALKLLQVYENAGEIKDLLKIYPTFADDLLDAGVVFSRVEETAEDGTKIKKLLVSYKETEIAKGDINEVAKKLDPFKKYGSGEKLENALEILNNKTILLSTIIKNSDDLISFLSKIDNSFIIEDLEKVGINVLFRGTTKTGSTIFKGLKNTQSYGFSTSTDPLRAIIFRVESSSKGGRQGILQIFIPNKMKGVYLTAPNRRVHYELEVILNSNSKKLEQYAIKEISIQKAREFANKYFKLNGEMEIPSKINNERISRELMENILPKTTPENSYKFYQELIKL